MAFDDSLKFLLTRYCVVIMRIFHFLFYYIRLFCLSNLEFSLNSAKPMNVSVYGTSWILSDLVDNICQVDICSICDLYYVFKVFE